MFDVLGIFRGVPFIGGFLTLGDSYSANVVRATRILGEWGDAMVDTDPFLLFRHFIGGGVPFFQVPSIFRLNTYDPNAAKAEETSDGGNSTPASSGGVTAAHGGDASEEASESAEAAEDPTKKPPKKSTKADEDDKKATVANQKAQAIIHAARGNPSKVIDLSGKTPVPRPKALTTGKIYEVGSDKIWVTDGINPAGISAFKLPVDASGTIVINAPSYIPKPYGVYISSESKIYLK